MSKRNVLTAIILCMGVLCAIGFFNGKTRELFVDNIELFLLTSTVGFLGWGLSRTKNDNLEKLRSALIGQTEVNSWLRILAQTLDIAFKEEAKIQHEVAHYPSEDASLSEQLERARENVARKKKAFGVAHNLAKYFYFDTEPSFKDYL